MTGLARVGALIAILAFPAAAEDAPLRFATGSDYGPYSEAELPGGGAFNALIRAIYAPGGRAIEIVLTPWEDAKAGTRDGRFDATFPYFLTEDRQQHFIYSDPVLTVENMVFHRGEDLTITRFEDLDGLRQCVPDGWRTVSPLRQRHAVGAVTLLTAPLMQDCIGALVSGAADFFTLHALVARYALNKADLAPGAIVAADSVSLPSDALHLMVGRTNPVAASIILEFNALLAAARREERIGPLLEGYLREIEINDRAW